MRKTKIICTIGPASQDKKTLTKLMNIGMNVARFNFSHGDHAEQLNKFNNVVEVREKLNLPVATMLDTKGPEIRLANFKDHKVHLKKNQSFTLSTKKVVGDNTKVSISYAGLVNDVKKGDQILIDDGLLELKVVSVGKDEINCKVLNEGEISDKKGVNVPNVDLKLPFISQKDKDDIIFGCQTGFDYIALSFVRCGDDIRQVKKLIKKHSGHMKIIAKIENMTGYKNIDEIIEEADGVMIARGDLGVEVPMQEVPAIQKDIIKRCNQAGKICITATQMLDSMIENPRPTRAEVADVANAIYDGSSAIMLSGESANGLYPCEACQTMVVIAERVEKDINYRNRRLQILEKDIGCKIDTTAAIAHSAVTVAEDIEAAAIITVTNSGFTAQRVSHYLPTCPIIAYATEDYVVRQMNLLWGVFPSTLAQSKSADALFKAALDKAKKQKQIKKGDNVVLTGGLPLGISGHTNMIKVVEVEKNEIF